MLSESAAMLYMQVMDVEREAIIVLTICTLSLKKNFKPIVHRTMCVVLSWLKKRERDFTLSIFCINNM